MSKNLKYAKKNNAIGICKFCLETKHLIKKSHIIPKCFLKWTKNENNEMTIINPEGQQWTEQDYFFEGGILCRECENLFSKEENYTYRFFEQYRSGYSKPSRVEKHDLGLSLYYRVDNTKIKRCLLSVLWRMSISNKDYYKYVNLGEDESKLRDGLWNNHFMDDRFFPISIGTTAHVNDVKTRFLRVPGPSIKIKTEGITTDKYVFLLPDIVIFFAITANYQPSTFGLSLKKDNMLLINYDTNNMSIPFYRSLLSIPDIPKF